MPHINEQNQLRRADAGGLSDVSAGKLGKHSVTIGDSPAIRLDSIKANKIPFAGFRTATKVASAAEGVAKNSSAVVGALTRQNGKLDAQALMSGLKTMQVHLDRQVKLGQLQSGRMDAAALAAFAPEVQKLGNNGLAAVYQSFASGEMALLKDGLLAASANPKAKDARAAFANLCNLEALVLKEVSNRVAVGSNIPGAEALRPLSEEYAGRAVQTDAAPNQLTSANLKVLVETAAQSATRAERGAAGIKADMEARNIPGMDGRRMGDVLRSAELTMNVKMEVLLGEDSPLRNPDQPWKNAFHLARDGVAPDFFTPQYMDRRNVVEQGLFPEFGGRAVNPDERPVYAALNIANRALGAASGSYGDAVLVLKPAVAQRATYTADDTFLAFQLAVTPERRDALYRLIPGAAQELTPQYAQALATPGTPERQRLDQYLDLLQGLPTPPNAAYLKGVEETVKCDMEQALALETLMLKAFADPTATRNLTATHDTLESLIPHMGELNGAQLAQAALNKQQHGDGRAWLSGINYIEAQVQGPLVLNRDVAEIRLNAESYEAMPEAGKQRLAAFSEATGVPVKLVSMNVEEVEQISDIEQAGMAFSAQHLDETRVRQAATELVRSPQAIMQRITHELRNPNSGLDAAGAGLPEGTSPLQGAALNKALGKFQSAVERALENPSPKHTSTEALINDCFHKTVMAAVPPKLEMLKAMQTLAFDSPRQKEVFQNWVLSAGALRSPAEMTMIHGRAKAQCDLLRELGSGGDASTFVDRFAAHARATDKAIAELFATMNPEDLGVDDNLTELNRVGFLSAALLGADGREPLERAQTVLTSPELKGFAELCLRLHQPQPEGISEYNADFGGLHILATLHRFALDSVSKELQVAAPAVQPRAGSLVDVPVADRGQLGKIFPQAAAELNGAHPPVTPKVFVPFPVPVQAEKLPQTHEARRDFLVSMLPSYLAHENSFDAAYAVHGRNHAVRAFVFATVLSNILEERGVAVDKNAVLCGIAGHDVGRQGNGEDQWEADSAALTRDRMRQTYGAEAMGEAYENALMGQIVGHAGGTVEAMLLGAADSLDIGRTKQFDLTHFPFLAATTVAGGVTLHKDDALRAQLAVEADVLQRLTNPLAAARGLMNELNLELAKALEGNNAVGVEHHTAQLQGLNADVRAAFAEERTTEDAAFVASIEKVIADNPGLFPLLTRYYH